MDECHTPRGTGLLLDLVMEVLVNYEVAGIQGDDRMPAMPSEGGIEPLYPTAL